MSKSGWRVAPDWCILFGLVLTSYSQPLQVSAPKGWIQNPSPPRGIIVQYVSPERGGGFNANLNVSSVPLNDSLLASMSRPGAVADYLAVSQDRLFQGYRLVKHRKKETSDLEGDLLVSTYIFGQWKVALYQLVFIHDRRLFNLAYTCLERDLERLAPKFEKSLETLSLDAGPPAAD